MFLNLQISSFFRSAVIFRHAAKKFQNWFLVFRLLLLTLKYSKNKNARELGVARRQFHADVNGFILFIFYNITLSSRFALDGFRFIFYCVTMKTIWSLQCVVQPNFNALGNIANAFENNNSMLESVSNGLKKVQCVFQCIFNAFWLISCAGALANRVTNRLTHPTETAIRHLVTLYI